MVKDIILKVKDNGTEYFDILDNNGNVIIYTVHIPREVVRQLKPIIVPLDDVGGEGC